MQNTIDDNVNTIDKPIIILSVYNNILFNNILYKIFQVKLIHKLNQIHIKNVYFTS